MYPERDFLINTFDNGGYNQAQLIAPKSRHQGDLLWQTNLEGSTGRVLLTEVLDGGRFLVVDWNAKVYLGNPYLRRCRLLCDLKGNVFVQALVSRDKSTLYLWKMDEDQGNWLHRICLRQERLEASLDLDAAYLVQELDEDSLDMGINRPLRLFERHDGQLLFYDMDAHTPNHGLHLVDPQSGASQFFPLSHPVADRNYEAAALAIDPSGRYLAMACADPQALCRQDGGFQYLVKTVDVERFVEGEPLLARIFSAAELGDRAAPLRTLGAARHVELGDYYDRLSTIAFTADGGLWLTWRDGKQSRLGLDGAMLPLFAPRPLLGWNEPFDLKRQAHDLYQAANHWLASGAGSTEAELAFDIPLIPLQQWLTVAPDMAHQLATLDATVLPVRDWQQDVDILATLEQLERLMLDVASLVKRKRLTLIFDDPKGQYWDEKAFVERALGCVGGAEILARVLRSFLLCPDAGSLYSDEGMTPALAHMAVALACEDVRYIDELRAYLWAIDLSHQDHFDDHWLCEALGRAHRGHPQLERLLGEVRSCFFEQVFD
ncbi:hypothetical protein [Gallaecimonas xiamenensis]|uniref:Uncharacterized protein n=1 Tax=Gallaecimonas xiamenensis 3-C-1 TaxID=745411 RepID=K2JR90_9GAMM|nr:hypothetical protein [Gallaecimonas xiamenensis]EKE77883.1 hypothetical protein B3C1_00445 [Gallaecimonas xiamenensis 3-C-1]